MAYEPTAIATNAIYALLSDILDTSDGLITEYQSLDNLITSLRNENAEPVAATWKQNIENTEEQLKLGARVAIRNVKKVLGAEVEDEVDGLSDEKDTVCAIGLQEGELNYQLHTSLKYAERGFKRMVKGIPADESH